MLLVDAVAQCAAPMHIATPDGKVVSLAGAAGCAALARQCPIRYVLRDALVTLCVELAYSDGAQLAACLDLVHVPAERLWLEWDDSIRDQTLRALGVCSPSGARVGPARRAGVLITSERSGRRARWRTLWSEGPDHQPILSPLETVLDLDSSPADSRDIAGLLSGASVAIAGGDRWLDSLLAHVAFRCDRDWQDYYRSRLPRVAERPAVARQLIECVGFDVPVVLALCLLFCSGVSLPRDYVARDRINAKRARTARLPLLDHIEVHAPMFVARGASVDDEVHYPRQAPRRHHVRGHIARRGSTVYWRSPHWRGHVRLGTIATRTVHLEPPRVEAAAATG